LLEKDKMSFCVRLCSPLFAVKTHSEGRGREFESRRVRHLLERGARNATPSRQLSR
jgi:hypothetical protein